MSNIFRDYLLIILTCIGCIGWFFAGKYYYQVKRQNRLMAQYHKLVVQYQKALAQIADPRLRSHRETDTYTELACVMNIANEALHNV